MTKTPPQQPLSEARVSITIPPITAEQGLRFVALLERICEAIWNAHGHEMGALLVDRIAQQPPLELPTDPGLPLPDDDDMPF